MELTGITEIDDIIYQYKHQLEFRRTLSCMRNINGEIYIMGGFITKWLYYLKNMMNPND